MVRPTLIKIASGLSLALLLAGCKTAARWELTLTAKDYFVLKPVFANTFVKTGTLNVVCAESDTKTKCVFTPGPRYAEAGLYHRLLKGDANRITILDTRTVPLATALRYEFDEEDLIQNKFITEDGRLTIEVGSMLGAVEFTAEQLCGKPKCCKPPVMAQFEHLAIVTIFPETVAPKKP